MTTSSVEGIVIAPRESSIAKTHLFKVTSEVQRVFHGAPKCSLLILATLGIGSAVISEATLSFLGLGIPRPSPPGASCWPSHRNTSTLPGGCR